MSLIVKNSGGDFELPSPGNHLARCYQVVELGVREKGGAFPGRAHQIRLAFELAELMADGRPFSVSEILTASLSKKSRLHERLVGWRGKAFTDEELAGFDLKKVCGVPALINVVINESGGKQYANIQSITPVPRGMTVPAPVNPPLVWEYGDDRSLLPEWLVKMLGDDPRAQAPEQDQYRDVNTDDDDDEIPF